MFNDLKAPRFNPRKFRVNIVSEELYKSWKNRTGRTESFEEFKKAWEAIADTAIDIVLENPDGIRLPKAAGDIYLGYVPGATREFVDYQASKEYGSKVRHQNWHSNQKPGKIIYGTRNRKYIYRLSNWWSFKGCRVFTRSAAKSLKDNPERYKNSIEKRI